MVAVESDYRSRWSRLRSWRGCRNFSSARLKVCGTSLGLTEVFIGVIIVAIVGNAAEHSTAVTMAMKNKMDLSVGIAVGSSLQIALFVAPVLVFLSYAFGRPMDLEFTMPEIVAVVVSVYILFQISGDGETNWIEGVQLTVALSDPGNFVLLSAGAVSTADGYVSTVAGWRAVRLNA